MSDGAENSKSVRPRGRWMLVILGASLLLNVFFVAAKVGHEFRRGGHHDGPRGGKCRPGDGVRGFVRANPDVRELADTLRRQGREALTERLRAGEALREAYQQAVQAEPFDPESLAAAQSAMAAERTRMRDLRDASVREFVGKLDPDQRARYAEHLAEQAQCLQERRRRFEERAERRERD